MPQILVRNLDAGTVDRLKKRAKDQGRSLQAEANRILAGAAEETRMTGKEFAKWCREFQAKQVGRKMPNSLDIIREGRNR